MTARAISRVPLDWQVEVATRHPTPKVLEQVSAFPGVTAALPVGYAHSSGYSATATGTSTSAGPGVVLGIPAPLPCHVSRAS